MENYYIFNALQNKLNGDILEEIFGKESEHFKLKWYKSNNNILYFLEMLDDNNKLKIFEYAKYNLDRDTQV